MPKLIIGIVGPIASGKGTIKEYLISKYGAKDCRFSTILRDVLKRLSLEINRDNLINLSTSLRQTFGQDLLAKVIMEDAKNISANIVVVDGVRRMEDIQYLKKLDGFILLGIDADPKIRYQRLVSRNENVGDDKKTYEEFLADHLRETEITIQEVMKNAKTILNNNGTMTELESKIDKFITNNS
jgi:dephospho-CoA kinase